MTDYKHPITPPPAELVQQWLTEGHHQDYCSVSEHVIAQAARWGADQQLQLDAEQINRAWQKGADQELEACCEWIGSEGLAGYTSRELRAARRPKPKSQAEEALTALDDAVIGGHIITTSTAAPTIRAALERLRELEGSND